MDGTSASRERWTLGAESAQLAAWVALALLNQALIALLLPPAPGRTRLLHHAYDLGQLLGLGALSWAAIRVGHRAAARLHLGAVVQRSWQALLLGVAAFVVGLVTAGDDVSNLAQRLELSKWLVTLGFALAFGLILGASRFLRSLTSTPARLGLAAVGVALAVLNALHLQGDYYACHLMAAWLSALLISNSLEGLTLPALGNAARLVPQLVAVAAGVATVLVPPPGDVRLRLYALPSSVLAPLIAGLLPDDTSTAGEHVPAKYKDSPWFKTREKLAPIPATRAVVPSQPPIVMFFTVDAFRADVMENPEYREKLPEFTRLRRESTYFRVARSPTASTMTTAASIFSGKYYSQLRWSGDKKVPLIEKTPRFPELLAQNGVSTLLVAGTLGRIFGASGVARGFATEVQVPPRPKPGTVAVDAIIADLERGSDGPRFIYSHFIEPHQPYDLAGKKGTPFQRYLREIGLVDKQLGRLRAYLAEKGLAERTCLIISADHGEGFGEHGSFNHARAAYEEMIHVPLFFYVPGRAGQELDTPVTLMDMGPSVLDLFGLPTPGFWMGQSLLPLVAGKPATLDRPIVIDTGGHIQVFYLDQGYKVIFTRLKHTTEVYNLKVDPAERTNLADSDDPQARAAIGTGNFFFEAIGLKEAGYESPEEKF